MVGSRAAWSLNILMLTLVVCSSLHSQMIRNILVFFFQQLKRELPKLQKGSNRSSLRKDKSFGKLTPGSATQISLIYFLLRLVIQLCSSNVTVTVAVTDVIIHMKKLLDSDWLRAVQFKCNTSAKSVTPVQITHRNSG